MATWGNTGTGTNNLNYSVESYAAGGAASLSGQQLDSVHVRFGSLAGANDIRVAVYGNSSLDINGATLIEDLGVQSLAGTEDFTWQTFNSVTNPTEISDYAYLFIAIKTNDNASNNVRYTPSSAAGDIDAFFTGPYDDETVAWAATHADADSDTNPGAFSFYITHSDAPAASGHGPKRGHARGARRAMGRGAA